jgi:hypothetical protein
MPQGIGQVFGKSGLSTLRPGEPPSQTGLVLPRSPRCTGVRHDAFMAGGTVRPDEENIVQGDFGEAWLMAIAAAQGLSHGRPDTVDLDKADVQLTLREEVGDTYHPTVKVQVKTTIRHRETPEGDLVYDLDVTTHNVLCRTNHSVRRILVVFALSAEGERVRLTDEGTLLVGQGAWVSLEGNQPTTNTSKQAVTLPGSNTIDEAGLRRMLETYGVRRSTSVPDFELWKE